MNLKQLLNDDDAVSPVIGVILMVAITVILAAVIASFVLGLGDSQQQTPTASFDYDYDSSATGTTTGLTITAESGDDIQSDRVTITGPALGSDKNFHDDGSLSGGGDDITSGTKVDINADELTAGEEVRITWSAEDQDSSTTLSTYEIPS